jgi:transposase-like protein
MTRKKRSFTPEYKAESVGLVRDGEKSISAVARDLGLSESALRRWVVQSETDAGRGHRRRTRLARIFVYHSTRDLALPDAPKRDACISGQVIYRAQGGDHYEHHCQAFPT